MKGKKTSVPKRGFKTVFNALDNGGFNLSNKGILSTFFTKKGTVKKSSVRSEKARQKFKEELQKAKGEIKEQREKRKALREKLKEERKEEREYRRQLKEKLAKEKKDKKKRKKQQKSYNQNGGSFSGDTYGTFVDILDEVYDEIALLFYDSDQIMEAIENGELSPEQIKELLIEMNKRKFENLTDKEKELLDSGKYKIPTMENEQMVDDLSECLYLATHSNLTPLEWYEMKQNNPMQFEQEKETVLENYD